MLKLTWTKEDEEQGRRLLHVACNGRRREDLEYFYKWLGDNVLVSMSLVRDEFDKRFEHDPWSLVRLYDATVKDYSPKLAIVRVLVARTL